MHISQARHGYLHRIFRVGLWVKALDGALELLGGLLFLLVPLSALNHLVILATQHELVEDPQDWVATTLRHTAAQLSIGGQLFGGLYLLIHGAVKIAVVAGVLRGHRWAYPLAIGTLGLFLAYQLYRLSYQPSLGLLLLTLFDAVIVGLMWREYAGGAARRAR